MVAVKSASRVGLAVLALTALRHLVPLVLVFYLAWRYDAWTDPAFLVGLGTWVLVFLAYWPMIRIMASHVSKARSG